MTGGKLPFKLLNIIRYDNYSYPRILMTVKIIQTLYRFTVTLITFILTMSLGIMIPIFLFVLLNIGGQ
jgi:hypothetical protein